MRVISVNVGMPREVVWKGRVVTVREGEIEAGDGIERVGQGEDPLSVADVGRLCRQREMDAADWQLMWLAARAEAHPEGWREHFRRRSGSRRG